MAKLLLVEDDNNLREIYEARLQAEGYTIVSAKDGEEALVVAKAEKPDLVIADVMMPKISGFEMLDILRNTDELKHVKVIMLTALGQSDDQQRADKLGADRYLVKSQVTLEDIVKVTHELLEGDTAPAAAAPAEPATAPAPEEPKVEPAPAPVPEAPEAPKPEPASDAADEAAKPAAEEEADVEAKIEDFVAGASSEPTAPGSDDTKTAASTTDDKLMADAVEQLAANTTDKSAPEASGPKSIPVSVAPDDNPVVPDNAAKPDDSAGSGSHKKIIEPLEASEPKKDIKQLLADEEAEDKPSGQPAAAPGSVTSPGAKDASGGIDPNSIAL